MNLTSTNNVTLMSQEDGFLSVFVPIEDQFSQINRGDLTTTSITILRTSQFPSLLVLLSLSETDRSHSDSITLFTLSQSFEETQTSPRK